jgi:hypothetical protein
MEEKENEDELQKITEEELKKMNMWEAEQKQKSIEKYGRDIYTNKEIGNKKMRKINNKIDNFINILHIIIPIVVAILLVAGLILAWGPMV